MKVLIGFFAWLSIFSSMSTSAALIQITDTAAAASVIAVPISGGPVFIENGDSVEHILTFNDGNALSVSGLEPLVLSLFSSDNLSSHTINNVVLELLGFSGSGGAVSTYNVGSISAGSAHIGGGTAIGGPGQVSVFTGVKITYDVQSIAMSPNDYFTTFLNSRNSTVVRAPTAVPAPATLVLFGVGVAGLGWPRRKKTS